MKLKCLFCFLILSGCDTFDVNNSNEAYLKSIEIRERNQKEYDKYCTINVKYSIDNKIKESVKGGYTIYEGYIYPFEIRKWREKEYRYCMNQYNQYFKELSLNGYLIFFKYGEYNNFTAFSDDNLVNSNNGDFYVKISWDK